MNAKIRFERRDIIALTILPLSFLISYLISNTAITTYPTLHAIIILTLYIAAVTTIFILYRCFLKESWNAYRQKFWLKIVISILGTVVMYLLLIGMRMLMPDSAAAGDDAVNNDMYSPVISVLLSFIPILVPFLEEIVFRYILFYKFKESRFLFVVFFFISAFLFGVVHLNNFNGDLYSTIPYMVIGAFLSLVYFFTKNIWYSISIHFVFNFMNGPLTAIAVVLLHSFA